MTILRTVPLLLIALAIAARAQVRDSILVGGAYRGYYLHLPAEYDRGSDLLPLVIGLHGASQDPVDGLFSFSRITGLDAKSDAEGFIVVYPEGTGSRDGGRNLTWNAGACCPPASVQQVDDITFIGTLLDHLIARYRVDPRRVYATGISNGGMMCYRLACEMGERIAAIAPVAAAYMLPRDCSGTRSVPVLHIHSLQDSVVPYYGGTGILNNVFPFPPVDTTIAIWRRAIGCTGDADTIAATTLLLARRWAGCDADGVVELYTTSDGGHSWPGSPVGLSSKALNATDVIWKFFSRFPASSELSVRDRSPDAPIFVVTPNPSAGASVVTVAMKRPAHLRLALYDGLGRMVATLADGDLDAGPHTVRLSDLPRGFYLLRGVIGEHAYTEGFARQ